MVVLDSVEILWRSFHEGEMLLSYNIIIREVIRKRSDFGLGKVRG